MMRVKRYTLSCPNPDGFVVEPFDADLLEPTVIVRGSDYDALAARLARAEQLLSLMLEDDGLGTRDIVREFLGATDSAPAVWSPDDVERVNKAAVEMVAKMVALPLATDDSADAGLAKFAVDLAAAQQPMDPDAAKVLRENIESLYISDSAPADRAHRLMAAGYTRRPRQIPDDPDDSAEAVHPDTARLDYLESQMRRYGDGYTEPREWCFDIGWQQSSKDEKIPTLREAIDAERTALTVETKP